MSDQLNKYNLLGGELRGVRC